MRYSTDLTDKQWGIIRDILPKENRGRHLQRHSKRELINSVLYLNKTGCQWRLLPKKFPNYKTVSSFYQRAVKSGLWENNKKIKGRKRHIVVDTMGNLLAITVHAANIHDTKSGINPAKKAFEKYPTIKKFCGDEGYRKSFEEAVLQQLGLCVDISKRIKKESEKTFKCKTTGIAKSERRTAEPDKVIKQIYEDNITGRLSDERFAEFLADYEKEQAMLVSVVAVSKAEVESIQAQKANVGSFIKLVERHSEIVELTAVVAREFVKKVVVHDPIRPEE